MKFQRILVLLVICGLLLAACGQDGIAYMSIAYQTAGSGVESISVKDTIDGNGFYVDEGRALIYCNVGPDDIVKLPPETQKDYISDAGIEIKVEAVCLMGQEKFDKFLELFQLVPATP